MPRSKPVTKLDVFGNLLLSPENVTGKIIESRKQENKYLPVNWDSLGDGVELLALQNDREHQLMLRLQAEMLDGAEQQNSVNRLRIAEVYHLQSILRKRFIQAIDFFKDCDDKKKAAETKVAEEKQWHMNYRQEIKTCSENIKVLKEFRETLKATVEEFEPYEEVINKVIYDEGLYSSIKDCTARCDALLMTQVEISEQKHLRIKEIEDLKDKMAKMTKDAALVILGLNNELHDLEKSYAQARSDCGKWESVLVNTKNALVETDFMKTRLLEEIKHMINLLCKFKQKCPKIKKLQIESQLGFITTEIKILRQVVEECSRQL